MLLEIILIIIIIILDKSLNNHRHTIEASLTKLSNHASKLVRIVLNPDAAALSEELCTASSKMEEMQAWFKELRSHPERFVQDVLPDKQEKIFMNCFLQLKCNILVCTAMTFLSRGDMEGLMMFSYDAL